MRLMETNLCTESSTTVVASALNPNFPVSNLKHEFRSKRVRTPIGTTSLTVAYDFMTTEAVDSVVLLWPREDGIRLTNSAIIKIQANATNTWDSPALDQVLTVDNTYSVASHYFTEDQTYRYWRVVIEDELNPWEYIELGLVWIGKSLDVGNAENGFTFQLVDTSKTTRTDFGHKYVDRYPLKAIVSVSYSFLDYPVIQIMENAFRRNGSYKPVMFIVDAEGVVFDKDHYAVYGTFSEEFTSKHINYNLMSVPSLMIEEIS